MISIIFYFTATATTKIYTLSLHDALPIFVDQHLHRPDLGLDLLQALNARLIGRDVPFEDRDAGLDRKSTRLNSSHQITSYAVFCLKKKTSQTSETAL